MTPSLQGKKHSADYFRELVAIVKAANGLTAKAQHVEIRAKDTDCPMIAAWSDLWWVDDGQLGLP